MKKSFQCWYHKSWINQSSEWRSIMIHFKKRRKEHIRWIKNTREAKVNLRKDRLAELVWKRKISGRLVSKQIFNLPSWWKVLMWRLKFMDFPKIKIYLLFTTNITSVRFNSSMSPHMSRQQTRWCKCLVANGAYMRFFTCMCSSMNHQCFVSTKRFLAVLTGVRFLSSMSVLMNIKRWQTRKRFATNLTYVRFSTSVSTHVYSNIAGLCKPTKKCLRTEHINLRIYIVNIVNKTNNINYFEQISLRTNSTTKSAQAKFWIIRFARILILLCWRASNI